MNSREQLLNSELQSILTHNISKPNMSPVLRSKDANPIVQKYYTPGLNNKSTVSEKLTSFVELKYLNRKLQSKNLNESQLGKTIILNSQNSAFKENSDPVNQSEDESSECSSTLRNLQKKKENKKHDIEKQSNKKLNKIQALFNRENFVKCDMGAVIDSWKELAEAYGTSTKGKNPIAIINAILFNFQPSIVKSFIDVFTDYNSIKQKVQVFYFMKIWTVTSFIYFNDKNKNKVDGKLLTWFETMLSQLLQSVFYLSLIISKAIRNGFVENEKQNFESFSKGLHKFQFPTGVPLIKTLKANSDNIMFSLKNVLTNTFPTLAMELDKSYLKNIDSFDAYIKNMALAFYPLLDYSYRSKLKSMVSIIDYTPLQSQIPKLTTQRSLIETTSNKPYTIVFDLDETLIHFKTENSKSKFLIRPHTYNILRNLHQHFEIIIFTAAQKEYADFILDLIDTNKVIAHRFYREHCVMAQNCHLKVG